MMKIKDQKHYSFKHILEILFSHLFSQNMSSNMAFSHSHSLKHTCHCRITGGKDGNCDSTGAK